MAEKTIIYSYPTSPNAKRFGFYNEGCWTVYWGAGGVKHFPTKEKDAAFDFAAACCGAYTRYSFTPDNYPVR